MNSPQSTTQIVVDGQHLPWDTGSPSLWSLWDMLAFAASEFFLISATLTDLAAYDGIMLAGDEGVPEMIAKIDLLQQHATNLGLKLSVKHIEFLKFTIRSGVRRTSVYAEILTEIGRRVHDELELQTFLFLPSDDAEMYKNYGATFPLTLKAFPSTQNSIQEASQCLALGMYTACVYHCMAIAQSGLHALANDLGVAFGFSLDLAEWNSVISAIENKIKPLRDLPRSDEKDAQISFYSECAVQFRYFKDAWRNHVCHMREVYDNFQAHSILLHVRDFMETLSTKLKELPKP